MMKVSHAIGSRRGGERAEGSDMFSKAMFRSAWLLAPVNTTLEDANELE
jgi:hypothetical protein